MNATCSVEGCLDACNLACTATACPGGAVVDADPEVFTDSQLGTIKAIAVTAALLSVCGSGFIIRTYHLSTHRPASVQIIYWLSVSDLLNSFWYIIDGATPANSADSPNCPNGLCVLLGALSQFFGLAAIAWNTLIAVNMHLSLPPAARIVRDERRYVQVMHGLAWGAALLSTVVPLAAGALGSAGQWCWVRRGFTWVRVLFFYGPLLLSLFYALAIFVWVRHLLLAVRRQAGGHMLAASTALPELTARSRNYLCVYGLIHIFRIANRLQEWLAPQSPLYALYLLHALFGPLQGLGNALVYGWTPRVRRLYADRYPHWCGWLDAEGPKVPAEHKPPTLATSDADASSSSTHPSGSAPGQAL